MSLPYSLLSSIFPPVCETEVKDGAALRTAHLRAVRGMQLHAGALWHGADGNPLPMPLQGARCWTGRETRPRSGPAGSHLLYAEPQASVTLVILLNGLQEVLGEGVTGQQAHQLSFPDVILT